MKKYIIFIFLFSIFLIAISLYENDKKYENTIEEELKIFTYFCPEDYCKYILISYIKNSSEIKCAFYELNLNDIIELLKTKNSEIIIEDSTYKKNKNLYIDTFSNSSNRNYSFLSGFSKALMHNKFCIFDKKIVFTGSMNPTFNDNYLNDNNILIIESKKLAELFLDEFYELKNNIYGKGKKSGNNIIYFNKTKIEVYFCPEDNCQYQVFKKIENAKHNIYFMTFSFTDYEIAYTLLNNKIKKNLTIIGVYDSSQISNYSTYYILKNFSILDKNEYKMHNKVFIIDNKTILTGSYNPTKNANFYNDENLIIIEDRDIAQKYLKNFFKVYNQIPLDEQINNINDKTFIKSDDLIIKSILPNPIGNDKNNEKIEIYNPTDKNIDLAYYKISNGKNIQQLNGNIKTNQSLNIIPKYPLQNKKGAIYLIKMNQIIDYVKWNFDNNLEGISITKI
ncbi:MAG: phospholipase D-like domain-containing protein [Candidatus Woesearchaeota archaeon]